MIHVLLGRFPVLPASLSELLRLQVADPQYFERVLALCDADAGFGSEVMRMANAAPVSPTVRIRSVREALLHVGPRPAVASILGGMLVRVFVPYERVMKELWERSVWVATACGHLASGLAGPVCDPPAAHTAGLLHDIGRLAMACTDPARYRLLLEECGTDPAALLAAEVRAYGANHAEIGGRLAESWGFSVPLREVIRHHHDAVPSDGTDEGAALCRLVAFADALASHRTDARHDPVALRLAARARLPLKPDDLPPLLARVAGLAAADVERLGLADAVPVAR